MTEQVSTSSPSPSIVELTQKVELSTKSTTSTNNRPQRKRRKLLLLSFVIMVVLPIILGGYYFAVIASDRYVSEAGFTVRGVNSGGGLDAIGAMTGLASSGSTTSDSYIILQYLRSRDIIEKLQTDIDLRASYSSDEIDQLSRLNSDTTIEELVVFWNKMITTSFDPTSGVVTFQIEAFKAGDAKKIADLVLGHTQGIVNRLSEDARQDSVQFARAEVTRAEERLRSALQSIRVFQEEQNSIDPAASAQIDIQLLGGLESRLIDIRARIATISGSVDYNAPSLVALRRQATALETQLSELSNNIGESQTGVAMSKLLATFEALEVEKNFAEKAYASSLSSLENARIEAARQQRYLAIFSRPALPQEAIYPKRKTNILSLIVACVCIWGIATLLVYSVRDHLS